jgi:hypothetical protein
LFEQSRELFEGAVGAPLVTGAEPVEQEAAQDSDDQGR